MSYGSALLFLLLHMIQGVLPPILQSPASTGNNIVFIQACTASAVASGVTSIAVKIDSTGTCTPSGGGAAINPATGDFVLVYTMYSGVSGTYGCSDSAGNTMSLSSSAANPGQGICRFNVAAGGADTVTPTNASSDFIAAVSLEFRNIL